MKIELYLAGRYLFRGRARHISFISIVSCAGVVLGVAALIIVISVMNGFDRDWTERLLRFNYHLVIEDIDGENLTQIKNTLNTWNEIDNASIFMQTQVLARLDRYNIFPLIVKGIDFNNDKEKKLLYQYVKQEINKDGFFIGEGLKNKFFLNNTIEFYTLTDQLEPHEGRIRGTFKIGLFDYDNNYLITDLENVKIISDDYFISLGVRLKNPFHSEELKNKIKRQFPSVNISSWIERNRVLFSALKLEKITMFIILSLIIVVASFNIFATLTVKVVEKTKDIGILKALGFTGSQILTIFSLQGVILGVMGVTFGSMLGSSMCIVLQKYPFIKLPEEIYYMEYLPVWLNFRDVLLVAFLGVILAFISSVFPAIKASKLPAAETLRYE